MHVHILGICGTFMGGIAAIAKAAGHRVTGSDRNVYPPMSAQLEALGIDLIQGYAAGQLDMRPDVVIVGNALSRGAQVIEAMLDRGMPYISGPQWLAEQVLANRHVLAVAGTHGKTTTSSMLAWILEHAGLSPGFLIGGVPGNFDATARLGAQPFFVIEADEYDTAFFDKRAKFVHYRPRTAVLNNLEYDHADIYPDVAAIRNQFNQLLRTVPASGRVVVNADDAELATTLGAGCWTPRETFGLADGGADWGAMAKLQYLNRVARKLGKSDPPRRRGQTDLTVDDMEATVAEFYKFQQQAREEIAVTELTPDTDLRDIFAVSKRRKTALPAHEFLHQHRKAVIDKVAQWTGAQRPLIRTLMDSIERRAGELDLRADQTRSAEHLAELTAYTTALVMTYVAKGKFIQP